MTNRLSGPTIEDVFHRSSVFEMLQGAPRRLVLAAVLFVAGFGVAFAQAEKVYVTRTGSKHHRDFCSSLRSSKIEMPLAEAAARALLRSPSQFPRS